MKVPGCRPFPGAFAVCAVRVARPAFPQRLQLVSFPDPLLPPPASTGPRFSPVGHSRIVLHLAVLEMLTGVGKATQAVHQKFLCQSGHTRHIDSSAQLHPLWFVKSGRVGVPDTVPR